MNHRILLVGSGGREHALAWKMSHSPKCEKLFIAPGNAGTKNCGENVNLDITDFGSLVTFCKESRISMLVVGPEDPLVYGITDYFTAHAAEIMVIGPRKDGAILEGSKAYSKDFMKKYNVPTAAYRSFDASQEKEANDFLKTLQPPYVVKASGLAAGKGVVILDSLEAAEKELGDFFNGKFGDASKTVVIEEFLKGIELSVFVLTDGKDFVLLPEAKDYKRIGEGDTGLNTGGMGAISPVPFAGAAFLKKVEERIIKPTLQGLQDENVSYKGFIFIGLMNMNGEPFVIEYNCRMGDPETEAVIPRIENDLVELFEAVGKEELKKVQLKVSNKTTATVILVSGGYPEAYEKGKVVTGIDEVENSLVFHAGTKENDGNVVTQGGRVFAITSFGDSIEEAVSNSMQSAGKVSYDKKYFRRDIGKDLMQGQQN